MQDLLVQFDVEDINTEVVLWVGVPGPNDPPDIFPIQLEALVEVFPILDHPEEPLHHIGDG